MQANARLEVLPSRGQRSLLLWEGSLREAGMKTGSVTCPQAATSPTARSSQAAGRGRGAAFILQLMRGLTLSLVYGGNIR